VPADAVAAAPAEAPLDGVIAEGEVTSAADIAARLAASAAAMQGEVDEIDLLINQAKTEAARHETRRSAAAEKLTVAGERLAASGTSGGKDLAELANQLVAVARKAALMEAQVDLLEGKRKSAIRLHEALRTRNRQRPSPGCRTALLPDRMTVTPARAAPRASWTSISAARSLPVSRA
jgi:hypothetical protein